MKAARRWSWGLGLLGAAYVGLPFLLVQVLNLGLVREGRQSRREVALTFDDGPDPATTPAVLDALIRAGAKATFFVLAGRAKDHPELIQRMLREGHQVEAHAMKHRHAWLRGPWGAYRDPIQAVKCVQAVTGQRVHYHRPPHGAYTLATWLGLRAASVRGAHWSLEGQDWQARRTPAQVQERLLRLLRPGAVIVLHDAGPGARNTVPMLPELLSELQARGYACRTLGDLHGLQPVDGWAVIRRAFVGLDSVFDQLGRVRPAEGRADNLFRIARTAFPLSGVSLQDGMLINRGTSATEFHVNNPLLVDLGLRRGVQQARVDFRAVAREMRRRPELLDTQVIFCLSALSGVIELVGFETHDLPPADVRRLQRWANVLRWAYGSQPNAPQPKLSILSRAAFLKLYDPEGTRP